MLAERIMEKNQNKNINRVGASCISSNRRDDDDNDAYFNSLPIGYRFVPQDDELIIDFLLRKVRNEPLPRNRIHVVELYKQSPQELTEYDDSLMISLQNENGYGSYFPPPLCSVPPLALNNFDQNLLTVNTTLNNNFAYNVPPIQSYPPCYSYGLQPIYDQACYDCMEIATMDHHLESAAEEPPFPQPIPASENNSLEFSAQPGSSWPDYTCWKAS
ncbi:hypothetical protein GH714_028272 [Hevea brasiliensis]|uniref:NAC domain-containing protein n=1 Tax=Hevea brasiliensis TaxID=3981 RepID=A0A6A6N7N5_HEVBR|nr:hypothetical protein GH714_028272 [Hevea brasiliensis]